MSDEPTTDHEPARRLTHSQIIAMMLARSGGSESSVSLTRNARGLVQIDVTARGDDIHEAEARAVAVYERLRALYPYPEAPNNGSAEA